MLREVGARLEAPRVAVLGPPAVGRPEALRPVPGHPGRLLAALAAANRPCSIDRLSEALWGDEPPATYRAALHVHLGSLRRRLADLEGSCSVERAADGYALVLGDCELDARLTVDLVTDAGRLLVDDPSASAELAEAALALWRGVPFSVDGDVVEPASAHQLEAVRRDGEEVLVEALLRTGQAARAESMAAQLVASEPLREHRWGQLLRARFLAGRTAEALATYQEARDELVESLGIEPGPELRALEAAALMQDTAGLRLPAGPDSEPPGPPPTAGPFVGREAEVRRVAAGVIDARRTCILGPPGVGKSRLAIEVAHGVAAEAVAWHDLRGATEPAARRALLDWAHRHPDGVVILDNAESSTTAAIELVQELGEQAPRVGIVVTSRVPLDDALPVELLGPLEIPELLAADEDIEIAPSAVLLRAALRDLAPKVDMTAREVAQVANRAGGLPLALRLSAAAARAIPVAVLIAQPPSTANDEIDLATRTVAEVLTPDARRAFADLSVLRGAFDADFGARVCGLSTTTFLPVVMDLVDHGLVQASPDRTLPYLMLEPIRAVAARLLDAAGGQDEAVERAADACIVRARELNGTDRVADLQDRLAADLPRHREAFDHFAQRGDAERALRLACYLDAPLYTLGWWVEKNEVLDAALRIRGEPSIMRARAHVFRARPGPMHQLDVEHAERAESMARDLGHDRLAAYSAHVRAIGLWWSGRTEESVELGRRAVEALTDRDQSFEWREARKYLGVAMVLAGEADAGLEEQREVLAVLRERAGTEFNVAHNLAYLGHCHRFLGDDTAASADWTEARAICRSVGNRGTSIHIDIGLAEVAVDRGDHARALERVGEALDLIRASNAAVYEPWAWTIGMRAHHLAGEKDNALACARRAIAPLTSAPPGETVRLAFELAALGLAFGEPAASARLLGVAATTPDRRELPFPSPAERERRLATDRAVLDHLGSEAAKHTDAGRRCTVAEAAGDLVAG